MPKSQKLQSFDKGIMFWYKYYRTLAYRSFRCKKTLLCTDSKCSDFNSFPMKLFVTSSFMGSLVFICQICLVTLMSWQISLRLLSGHISCPSTETHFNVLFWCKLRTFLTIFACLKTDKKLPELADVTLQSSHVSLLWLMIDCRSCVVALIGCRSCYPTGYRGFLVMSKMNSAGSD